jgi:two-component system, LytTR family, response regulator
MTKKLPSIVLIDDEACARDNLKKLLATLQITSIVAEAASAIEGITVIKKYHPELVFLDVEMPQKNGFDMLRELSTYPYHPVIIFVTAYTQYAIEAIKNAAFDYLLKPVDLQELDKAMYRYSQQLLLPQTMQNKINLLTETLANYKKLSFNVRSGTLFIDPEEILYCRAEGNYTSIFLTCKRVELITCQLGILFDSLSKDNFLRVGRSWIINQRRLVRINRIKRLLYFNDINSVVELQLSSSIIHEVTRKTST